MSDALAEFGLTVYRRIGPLLGPALRVLLALRTRAGKEDPARRGERLGRAGLARPEGGLVWVHAASVGETLAVLGLVDRLVAGGATVLLTTGTVTSATIAANRLPAGALHQYVPLDLSAYVGRFLDHWRPDLAIFVESEIWPGSITELDRRGIPQVLVNARISARSARRWGRLDGMARALFGRLTLTLAQSEGDRDRLVALGARDVVVTGNLKFDGGAPAADPSELARLRSAFAQRPTWLAASTHPGEEAIAAEVHARLKTVLPEILTVIAPRHPTRGDELRVELAARGLAVASRSLGETPGETTDVYLADTIGEMGLIYRLAPVAFVGGSIAPRGGQNPIEPARIGTAVVHGPDTRNFADIYRAFDAAEAAVVVETAADLAAAVLSAHHDPAARAARVARAGEMVERSAGALDRTMAAIDGLLAARAADTARGAS